jgi:hypothetical protein
MSTLPEGFPPPEKDETLAQQEPNLEAVELPAFELTPPEEFAWRDSSAGEPPAETLESTSPQPLFAWYDQPPMIPPTRIPNFGDVGIVILMMIFGWIGSGLLLAIPLHFHVFGVHTWKEAGADVRYNLGSQALWYVLAFSGCLILLPALWRKSFLDGVQWRGAQAFHLRWRLLSATFLCFFLAMADSILIPQPADTPIDQIFRIPGAAWLLFAFGVTLAPFFEEMAFRGFLLPAFCTACDWAIERRTHSLPRWPDVNGHPRWSKLAMAIGSLLTSVPFALMHAEQTGYSIGPFLLLVCVSLVLCYVRLSARSLAASVLVHSSYNFMLFALMLAGTGGFKHLEKM